MSCSITVRFNEAAAAPNVGGIGCIAAENIERAQSIVDDVLNVNILFKFDDQSAAWLDYFCHT